MKIMDKGIVVVRIESKKRAYPMFDTDNWWNTLNKGTDLVFYYWKQ